MRNVFRLLTAAALAGLTGCTSVNRTTDADSSSMQTARHFKFKQTITAKLDYLLFLPRGYDAKSGERWPLIFFLHGAGERGTNIWKVATHGPPKNVKGNPDFPFIVVSPQCPEGENWSDKTLPLLGLLDSITDRYAVDTNRIYLTGLSMGGYGTWSLGLSYPERFAAIVPICGGGERIKISLSKRTKQQALKTLGVWAFHGGKDPLVPLEESQRMVEALKKAGVEDVKLTVYPEAKHDSWTQAYNTPELYDWLLKHQRK